MKNVTALYSDGIYLNSLSDAQKADIVRELTFKNPAYEQALRYSPYERIYCPETLCYAESTSRGFRVPIGYTNAAIEAAVKTDERIYHDVEFPEFKYTLRDIQKDAAEAYLESNTGFDVNSLCVAQTGSGKTSLALYIASQLGQRTLVLCHKLDLIDQFRDEAKRAFDGKLSVGEYHGKKKTQGEHLTIASHQTLSRMDESAQRAFIDSYGLIVVDEAHTAAAPCFSLVNKSRARYKLGITATPERNDGLTHVLFCFFGGICYQTGKSTKNTAVLPAEVIYRNSNACVLPIVRKGIAGYAISYYATSRRITLQSNTDKDGNVVTQEMTIYEVPHAQRPNVDSFKIDDLYLKQLWNTLVDDVLCEYEQGHSCLVMFKQKKHVDLFAQSLAEYEDEDGNEIDFIKYYGDNLNCSDDLTRAREKRKLITIATYSKVTEGTDCKLWEVAFVASSIGNGKNTEQAVGRIRRVCDTPKLDTVRIYDYRAKDVYTYTTQAKKRDERYAQLGFRIAKEVRK